MEFRLLGPVEALRDGRPVVLGGAKQRALLGLLLLHANEVVSKDRMVDELWRKEGSGEGEKALRVAITRLRKVIEPNRSAAGQGGVLLTRPPGYILRVAPGELDLHRFEELAAEGRAALAAK